VIASNAWAVTCLGAHVARISTHHGYTGKEVLYSEPRGAIVNRRPYLNYCSATLIPQKQSSGDGFFFLKILRALTSLPVLEDK
jgi:hypothetical protein